MVKGVENIVKVKTFGNVDVGFTEKLLDVFVDCYEKLGPPMTYSVNLNIFETSEEMGFFASHDALAGKPTINIYLDRIKGLPLNLVEAGVRRQAAHSILHGSPEFYKLKFPDELKRVASKHSLPESFATQILYGAAMAAKEYNVTKILVEAGFIEDQAVYAKYMLEPSAEELKAWEIAKSNPMARIIYLVMTIRDISCAIPLFENPAFGKEIKEYLEKRIEHLPDSYKSIINKIIVETIQKFSEDTFTNINLLTKAFVENIIHKELAF